MSLDLPLSRHAPHDPVFDGEGGALSAAELWGIAAGVSERLPPDCRAVVLACRDRARFSAALLAAWHRGLPVVLPAVLTPRAIERLAASEGTWLAHDADSGHGLDVRSVPVVGHAPLSLPLETMGEAVRVHTSGSTGAPSAHGKTAGQLLGEVACLLECFELGGARVVASVSPHHIYGLLFGVLVPLCGGGVASREAPLMPGAVKRTLDALRADVWVTVPAHLRAMVDAGEHDALAQRRVFSSAAPLPHDVGEALRSRRVWLCEILGSTETGGVARRLVSDAPWQPLPGVRVAANDEGVLTVDSPWLHPNDLRPRATFDRIELSPEGGFWHRGRADRVVKVAGRRVDLGAIESLLRAQSGVSDARVVASDSESARGQELWAAVETSERTPSELREALRPELDPVTLPRRMRCVSALPRTTAGKVTNAAVRMLFEAETWQLPSCENDDGWDLEVPPGLGHFDGHFDGLPILPGVVQLATVVQHARTRWPGLGALQNVARAKFKAPLEPGDRLHLTLTQKTERRVHYRLTRGGADAATGVLEFAPQTTAPGGTDE